MGLKIYYSESGEEPIARFLEGGGELLHFQGRVSKKPGTSTFVFVITFRPALGYTGTGDKEGTMVKRNILASAEN